MIAWLSVRTVNASVIAGVVASLLAILLLGTIYFRALGRLAFVFSHKLEVEEDVSDNRTPADDVDSELTIHV